jgi:hypothetical protein
VQLCFIHNVSKKARCITYSASFLTLTQHHKNRLLQAFQIPYWIQGNIIDVHTDWETTLLHCQKGSKVEVKLIKSKHGGGSYVEMKGPLL